MILGIIKEGKVPPDNRVPLTPEHCQKAKALYGFEVVVQHSPNRCFADEDYVAKEILVTDNMQDCDVLFGVKEVPIDELIARKTYFFFSHTIKKQAHNRELLRAILAKGIRLIDYEAITNKTGQRIIAFGKFAGMVGAHNAIWTYLKRHHLQEMPRMYTFPHYDDAARWYRDHLVIPPIKVLLTGTGRVASGARKVLEDMGFRAVSPADFLDKQYDHGVFTQLSSLEYVRKTDGTPHTKEEFYAHPEKFESALKPYTRESEVFINGIFWHPSAPAFFTIEDMKKPAFKIEVIADVTCDIAPMTSVPCTLKPSTIADPVYGFDPATAQICEAFKENCVDVMAIDNLPNELARDASIEFGSVLLEKVLPELLKPYSEMLERATVALDGRLGPHFQYLADYVGFPEKQT